MNSLNQRSKGLFPFPKIWSQSHYASSERAARKGLNIVTKRNLHKCTCSTGEKRPDMVGRDTSWMDIAVISRFLQSRGKNEEVFKLAGKLLTRSCCLLSAISVTVIHDDAAPPQARRGTRHSKVSVCLTKCSVTVKANSDQLNVALTVKPSFQE